MKSRPVCMIGALEATGSAPVTIPVAMVTMHKQPADPPSQASAAQQAPSTPEAQTGQPQFPFEETTDSMQLSLAQQENKPVRERMERVLREYVDISGYFRAG